MSAENLPCSRAEPRKQRSSLLRAEPWVGVHRRHQNRRVMIVLRLLRGHILHIYKNVAAENHMIFVIYQNRLTRQVSALALVQFKMQLAEVKKSRSHECALALRFSADLPDLFVVGCLIRRKYFADLDIRLVQRIMLAVAVAVFVFHSQTFRSVLACVNRIKSRQQSAVVYVRVRDKNLLLHAVKFRDKPAEYTVHLIPAIRISGIHKQILPITANYRGIAPARRLNQNDFCPLRDLMLRNPRHIPLSARL